MSELEFRADTHTYQSIKDPARKWVSSTGLVGVFKQPFNPNQAELSSKSKRGKWKGMDPKVIQQIWDSESKRATDLGSWYHDQREADVVACETLTREGLELPIFRCIEMDDKRFSPDQTLVPGIYPEHFCYLKSAGICGQADRVEVVNNKVDIYDYKTNKEVKTEPYITWDGTRTTMQTPLSHLDDCHITHYALQLSIYMYIVLKHNHTLEAGKMQIQHVVFEVESYDENGYPITARDFEGNPIVKEVVDYDLPYLKSEVISMIKYMKTHPELFNND